MCVESSRIETVAAKRTMRCRASTLAYSAIRDCPLRISAPQAELLEAFAAVGLLRLVLCVCGHEPGAAVRAVEARGVVRHSLVQYLLCGVHSLVASRALGSAATETRLGRI